MGSRDPDLIASPPHPLAAVTLGEMLAERWIITAYCPQCRTRLHVDLAALARLLGDDFVFWGRHPRCKVWVRWTLDRRCDGHIEFSAQASQTGSAVPLRMTGVVRDAIRLRGQAMAARR